MRNGGVIQHGFVRSPWDMGFMPCELAKLPRDGMAMLFAISSCPEQPEFVLFSNINSSRHVTFTMKQQVYFPSHLSKQILWLAQFRLGFPAVAVLLKIQPKDIEDTLNDIDWLLHGLRGLRAPLEHLAKAVTAFNKTLQSGEGDKRVIPPPLSFPEPPASLPPRPGALKRLFKMVQILKRSQGYDESMGRKLGIESNLFSKVDAPAPTFKLKLVAGDTHAIVEGRFRCYGRPGVWVECQRGEDDWEPVGGGIFCRSTFRDDRPLLDPTRPEYRHYRMRFWDAKPFGEWSPVAMIMVGG